MSFYAPIRWAAWAATGVWLAMAGGCRLPGGDGPVSQSVVNCRQLSQQGVAAMERGEWRQAEALLNEAVEACPVDADARAHLAEALWQRGARDEAITQLSKAAELAPDNAALHVRAAEMQLAKGDVQAAQREADAAIDLDPKLASAWAVRGRVLSARGLRREALADFHRALGYSPDSQRLKLEVAELYRELNAPQKALAVLQNLAETYSPGEEPQHVLYLQGLALMALSRYDDACNALAGAALRAPPTAEILYRLADAELKAGRAQDAIRTAEQAVAMDPRHEPSRQLLGRIKLAQQRAAPLQ
jgi:tetratricopeptide (TPR) repeat protein